MTSETTCPSLKSGRVSVEAIGASGLRVELCADADERAELARLNDMPAVQDVRASLLLRLEPRGGVWITGEVRGSVTQICVVSLDSFDSVLVQPVDVHFLPAEDLEAYRAARAKRLSQPGEPEDEEEEPDPIVNGRIDLGALVGEIFTLGIDLYPRKPGVAFDAPAAPAADASPFAALQALKGDKT